MGQTPPDWSQPPEQSQPPEAQYPPPGQPGYTPQPPGYQPQPGYAPWQANQPPPGQIYPVAPKSPGVHLLVSFFLPGVGTLMNGETGKGLVILLCWIASVLLSFLLIGLPFAIGLWIWGMIDAYSGARRWNARHGIVS